MGRPTKLNEKITVPGTQPDGTTTTRQVTVAERIVENVSRLGMRPSLAGREAGVDAETVWKWIREGREAHRRRTRNLQLDRREQQLSDFVSNLDQARARYLADQLDLHEQIARGGLVVAEITEEVDPSELVPVDPRDPDGEKRPKLIKRKVKSKRLLPNHTALWKNIERKSRRDEKDGEVFADDEGFGERHEITGADGEPLGADRLSREEREARLLAEADAYLAGLTDGRERESESSRNGAEP